MNAGPGRNVVLIGYRGSGKSAVGSLLAGLLKVPHIDTDVVVAAEAGMSIADIFACQGEEGFRRREGRVVARAAQAVPAVISAGGGVVLSAENMRHLAATGTAVWLTARAEVLFSRMAGDERWAAIRPDLTSRGGLDEVRALLSMREPLYRRWADVTFSSEGRSPGAVAREVAAWFTCGS